MTRQLTTIVADGQAGAAYGAIAAAVDLDLGHGGWTAAEDLPAIYAERARRTVSPRMAARLNVQDSDGTLIVSFAQDLRPGTYAAYADEAAEHQRTALLHLVLPAAGRSSIPDSVRSQVLEWVTKGKIAVLHVAGPRETEEAGIQQAVHDALVWIFEEEASLATSATATTPSSGDPVAQLPDTDIVRLAGELAEAGPIGCGICGQDDHSSFDHCTMCGGYYCSHQTGAAAEV